MNIERLLFSVCMYIVESKRTEPNRWILYSMELKYTLWINGNYTTTIYGYIYAIFNLNSQGSKPKIQGSSLMKIFSCTLGNWPRMSFWSSLESWGCSECYVASNLKNKTFLKCLKNHFVYTVHLGDEITKHLINCCVFRLR